MSACALTPNFKGFVPKNQDFLYAYNSGMAAIDLTKLDNQIQELLTLAGEPKAFQRQFHTLLSFYHRYSHRAHKDAIPMSFMRHYDLPEKVLLTMQNQLKALDPKRVLPIASQLGEDDYFEARDTAASLLGQLPLEYKQQTLQMITDWISEPLDRAVVESVFSKANRTVTAKAMSEWTQLVSSLISSASHHQQKMGLLALTKLIPEMNSDDLPTIFRWVRPFLIDRNRMHEAALIPVVGALAKRSSQETAYMLREILADSNDEEIGRRFRHYLDFFEASTQKRLQEAIKNQVILPRSE